MTNRGWCIILIALGIIGQSCRKLPKDFQTYQPIGDTKLDSLRIYNLLTDSSEYNNTGYVIYVNDSSYAYMGRGLFYRGAIWGVPPSINLSAQGGQFTIKLTKYNNDSTPPVLHPDPSHVVCQQTVNIPAHSGFGNVIFYDSAGTPAVSYMPLASADPGAPAPGTFKLRVINFGYDLTAPYYTPANSAGTKFAVQLQYQDSTIVKGDDNIPFGTVSNYQQFAYGTEQFMVYNLTTQSYNTNPGPFNDVFGTFGLFQDIISNTPGSDGNWVFPNYSPPTIYVYPSDISTTEAGNIASYPFSAGGCYSILCIGNMYAVSLDRMYDPGVLDNFGKIQVVNADPGQPEVQVTLTDAAGHQTQIPSIRFGGYADPVTVPAGPVTCTFTAGGQTLYTYSTSVPRLGDYTLYLSADLTNTPFVFPANTVIDPQDFISGGQYSPPTVQMGHVFFLNLSPDAGTVFFTDQNALNGDVETALQPRSDQVVYKGGGGEFSFDGTKSPDIFNVRLSATRSDSLASYLAASLKNPFPRLPCPGSYTLVAAGLFYTTDTTKSIRLIMVPQSNFISKAL